LNGKKKKGGENRIPKKPRTPNGGGGEEKSSLGFGEGGRKGFQSMYQERYSREIKGSRGEYPLVN